MSSSNETQANQANTSIDIDTNNTNTMVNNDAHDQDQEAQERKPEEEEAKVELVKNEGDINKEGERKRVEKYEKGEGEEEKAEKNEQKKGSELGGDNDSIIKGRESLEKQFTIDDDDEIEEEESNKEINPLSPTQPATQLSNPDPSSSLPQTILNPPSPISPTTTAPLSIFPPNSKPPEKTPGHGRNSSLSSKRNLSLSLSVPTPGNHPPIPNPLQKVSNEEDPLAVVTEAGGADMSRTASSVTLSPIGTPPHPSQSERPVEVFGVLVVGFNHQLGPTVEYAHPPEILNHSDENIIRRKVKVPRRKNKNKGRDRFREGRGGGVGGSSFDRERNEGGMEKEEGVGKEKEKEKEGGKRKVSEDEWTQMDLNSDNDPNNEDEDGKSISTKTTTTTTNNNNGYSPYSRIERMSQDSTSSRGSNNSLPSASGSVASDNNNIPSSSIATRNSRRSTTADDDEGDRGGLIKAGEGEDVDGEGVMVGNMEIDDDDEEEEEEYDEVEEVEDLNLEKQLPFLALPDGAHAREEDYSYFHLLVPSLTSSSTSNSYQHDQPPPSTIFGISCNRQISSSLLLKKTSDVTRSTVQKAIVVLANKPVFGPIRDKLGVITRAFFDQGDFGDKEILVQFHSSLQDGFKGEIMEEGSMYMGTSLRELVYKFRFKTLMLLKLVLLQRKIMFYCNQNSVESLCTFQYSLISLIPALLLHLDDTASPVLDERARKASKPTSLKSSDKQSLLRYLGMPLNIFGKGGFFQPYLPLQQIDMLRTDSYLVGTTNSIFQQQKDCAIDVLVNIDTAQIDIVDPKLAAYVNLTAADRKWMEELVSTVTESWNPADPSRPLGMKFVGSDDFLRAKFEEYICSSLAAIKFVDFLGKGEKNQLEIVSGSGAEFNPHIMQSFNVNFIAAFRQTEAFKLWDKYTDNVIFDLVEPRHPMEGKTSVVEDVGIRLVDGLHGLHLEEKLENLGPAREAISRSVSSGTESVWRAYQNIRSEVSRRQQEAKEARERRAKEMAERPLSGEQQFQEGGLKSPTATQAVLSNQVMAGVDVAKERASTLATGFGSFISSKRAQFFAPKTPTSPNPAAGGLLPPSPNPASLIPEAEILPGESSSTTIGLGISPLPIGQKERDSYPPKPLASVGSDSTLQQQQQSSPPPPSPAPSFTSTFSSFFRGNKDRDSALSVSSTSPHPNPNPTPAPSTSSRPPSDSRPTSQASSFFSPFRRASSSSATSTSASTTPALNEEPLPPLPEDARSKIMAESPKERETLPSLPKVPSEVEPPLPNPRQSESSIRSGQETTLLAPIESDGAGAVMKAEDEELPKRKASHETIRESADGDQMKEVVL